MVSMNGLVLVIYNLDSGLPIGILLFSWINFQGFRDGHATRKCWTHFYHFRHHCLYDMSYEHLTCWSDTDEKLWDVNFFIIYIHGLGLIFLNAVVCQKTNFRSTSPNREPIFCEWRGECNGSLTRVYGTVWLHFSGWSQCAIGASMQLGTAHGQATAHWPSTAHGILLARIPCSIILLHWHYCRLLRIMTAPS